MPLPTINALNALYAACLLVGIWVSWIKFIGPRAKRRWNWVRDLSTVFVGRPARMDRVTGTHVARVPSLVDALVQIRDKQDEQGTAVTTALDNLTAVVTQVADQQIILGEHTRQLADLRLTQAIHTEQIGLLKLGSQERTAIHRDAAAMFDMVAKRDSDVIDEPPAEL